MSTDSETSTSRRRALEDAAVDESSNAFDPLLRRAARLTPLPPPRALGVGSKLCGGRFEIKRRLGAGGMGVVHEAVDHERGRCVALKTLARLEAADVYRLKNEFRALAEVTHPNLVRLHELFGDDGSWLFTMDLVAGQPFGTWVRPAAQLDLDRLRRALPQLVAGLRAIHAAGKLHRDIKPNNVLVTEAGHVVILDFGLVADRDPGGAGQTVASESGLGTPAYMAPELFQGAPASSASDWYSVGVTLFEALTGRLPFEGASRSQSQRKLARPAPRAGSITPHLPEDLDALCAALLARDPSARPTEDAIVEALESHALAGSAVSVALPPARPPVLLGRAEELSAFRSAYASAQGGQSVLLRVTGESGMGKSEFVGACLAELQSTGVVVLYGRCYERESVPYKAFDRVIDELTRYLRRLPSVEVASVLPRNAAALARIFPVLGRIDLVANAPERAAPDEQELRRRAFDALAELLAKIRDRRMLVLCIDDLHWLDHDSVQLLEHLLAQSDLAPLLIIASYHALDASPDRLLSRVDAAARANRCIHVRDIALGPLAPAPAYELARRLLGDACSDELAQHVAHVAAGSPFFIGELARHAVETGASAEHASMALDHAVQRRAERLGHAADRMLDLLATSGRPTPIDVLLRAADTIAEPRHALDLLRAAHLVRDSGSRAYECYHDRIRAAVTERIAAPTALEYHRRLVAAWSERADRDPEVLFEHCLAAGEREAAARHAIEAATKAAGSLAFERSAAYLAQAIGLMSHAEALGLGLCARRAEALSLAGRWADAAQAYAQAAEQSTEAAQRAELLRNSALHALGSGRSAEGLPRLRRLFADAGIHWPRTQADALARALFGLLWAWLWSTRRLPTARRTARSTDHSAGEAAALDHLLVGAACIPPYDHARGVYFMSVFARRALRSGEAPYVSVALSMLATLFSSSRLTRGSARRLVDQACAMARTHAVFHLRSAALSFAAWTRLLEDRLPEALQLSTEAGETLRSSGRMYIYQVWAARAVQSMALFAAGRVRDAVAQFAANARLARELGDDMAIIGGDSVLRHLVADDLERAHALVEHKASLVVRAECGGALRDFVQVERTLCALYTGSGAELLRDHPRWDSMRFAMPEYGALSASCALQGRRDDVRAARRVTDRTVRRLRRRDRSAADRAMAEQYAAALHLIDGDIVGAADRTRNAAELYRGVNMALHEAVMRVCYGRLRGDPDARRGAELAREWMISEGIVRPDAWVQMLAPGLDP